MNTKRPSLKDEIKQTKAFEHREAEVYLNLLRTSEGLGTQVSSLLRQVELSLSQYNVLRILRGAGEQGLCGREILERMVTRDSDMTRLLDGLEKRRLIRRIRSDQDRRIIVASLTSKGLDLLDRIYEPLNALHKQQLGHLGDRKLRQLNSLLEEARHQK